MINTLSIFYSKGKEVIQMKEIIPSKNYYLKFLVMILILNFLSACNVIPPTKPIINSFLASPPTITEGSSSILSWAITDATSATIDHGIGNVAATTGT